MVRFRYSDGKEFWFLAARHSVDRHSSTHAFIRHMLATGAPERLILEGYFDDPARLQPQDYELFRRKLYPENRYALALALRNRIGTIGGDLSDRDTARTALAAGFQLEDVLGTHIVRKLAGQISTATVSSIEASVKRQLGQPFSNAHVNFDHWYLLRAGEPLSLVSVRRTYDGPCGNGIIADVASFESEVRNRHLLAVIERARGQVNKIGVIFGANHLYSTFSELKLGALRTDITTLEDIRRDVPESLAPPIVD